MSSPPGAGEGGGDGGATREEKEREGFTEEKFIGVQVGGKNFSPNVDFGSWTVVFVSHT